MRYGEFNTSAKLLDTEVRAIMRSLKAGRKTRLELSIQYGVSSSTISAISGMKTWKHMSETLVVRKRAK